MKKTFPLALCAVIASFSTLIMFLTGFIPVGTYAAPCIAGVLLCVIVIEIGYPAAFASFIAVSLLSFLLSADKEAALYYALFFGFYPIIKGLIERLKSKALQYILKFSVFNICMISVFFLAISALSVPRESFVLFGLYIPWVFLLVGNGIFIIYDLCVTRLITIYLSKWRKLLKIRK